jgi:D-alanyl-D-alanine carboxypeptidase
LSVFGRKPDPTLDPDSWARATNGPRRVRRSQTFRVVTLALALAPFCFAALPSAEARAGASILIEADTGKVLRADNATYPWYPASVTKLMTLYLTLRAVKQKRITLDTVFTVSRTAAVQAPSKMGFPPGMQVTADNAIKMLMVHSANDMAVVLAEGVDGSIENFADDMTSTAHALGMTQSNFVNPNGLPADGQIVTARDLAILARALIREFPEYDYFWHIPAIKLGSRVMRNTNSLIGRYPGIDGMKTGFICASGFNVVASATRNGRRLIAVVLGASSSGARAVKAAELLESGFTQDRLSWLTSSLGTVEALVPIDATPPNLHEEICGGHHKKPVEEEEEASGSEEGTNGAEAGTAFSVLLSSLRAPTQKGASLLSDQGPVAPIVVYTGPTRSPAQIAKLSTIEEAAPHSKKKGAKTAKGADEDAADGKPSPNLEKPTSKGANGKDAPNLEKPAGKSSDEKAAPDNKKNKAWTPTSSSTLAASPPPELQTKPAAEQKKKPKAAKVEPPPAPKPGPAPAQ